MTEDLNDLLVRRAERARTPQSPDSVVAEVTARAEADTRARRNRVTIASGAAVLVAVATVSIVVADSGNDSTQRSVASSNGHSHSRRSLGVDAVEARQRAAARQQERRQLAARAAQLAAEARRRRTAGSDTTLVPVDPAPSSAEISIGLLPQGYEYLGHNAAMTWYGPRGGSTTEPDFGNDVLVDVHLSVGDMSGYTLSVGGRPAEYDSGPMVRVRYNDTIDVGFQAPASAGLTEPEALRMAASLDVRGTANTTKG